MEIKSYAGEGSLEIKDVDGKKGIVSGYFSAFGNVDSDNDVITKGAFTKTINESGLHSGKPCRIKHLLNHDTNLTVAVIQHLEEDNIGLRYESKAGSHTLGQDWLKMCEDGIITEHSIGFLTIKSHKGKHESGASVNYLTELRLFEGSSLTAWGANSHTPIVGVKSLEDFIPLFKKLEKALQSGTYTDEMFIQIQNHYNELGALLKEYTPKDTLPEEKSTKPIEEETEEKSVERLVELFRKELLNGRVN